MGILDEFKRLIKKAIKSPIKSAIVYFLIRDILNKSQKESVMSDLSIEVDDLRR